MKRFQSENFQGKTLILVAPLDWGLGHATRCIPIIHEIRRQGAEVILAAEGAQAALLAEEFPDIKILNVAGYRIGYGSGRWGMLWKLLRQLPKLRDSIRKENRWLRELLTEIPFTAVISDHRYGLHNPALPCVFVAHQLQLKSMIGNLGERILRKWTYKHISRFNECWIPDNADKMNSLAGELSHPNQYPSLPVKFLGPVSRLRMSNTGLKEDKIVILLSGPEPQRSILENRIIDGLVSFNEEAVVVRGLPGHQAHIPSTRGITFYNHLPAAELNELICSASYVISRCGYSTVMDLVGLQKKSILIPTPGQTEQEYLGRFLNEKSLACCIQQDKFFLDKALDTARAMHYRLNEFIPENGLEATVREFLVSLAQTNPGRPVSLP